MASEDVLRERIERSDDVGAAEWPTKHVLPCLEALSAEAYAAHIWTDHDANHLLRHAPKAYLATDQVSAMSRDIPVSDLLKDHSSKIEITANEVAPSLRWATVEITKTQRPAPQTVPADSGPP
jgi:hypothetical protein